MTGAAYSDRITFLSLPMLSDLETAKEIDGIVVAHLEGCADYEEAERKAEAIRVLLGLEKNHPLLTRLFVLHGSSEDVAAFIRGATEFGSGGLWFL